MEDGHPAIPVVPTRGELRSDLGSAPLGLTPPRCGRPGSGGDAVGDPMEPGTQRVPNPERAGLLDQDEESGLEGILNIIRIAECAAADAQDHRPVPLYKGCEGQLGRFASLGREPFEELTVRQLADGPQVEEGSELPPDGPVRSDRHEFTPRPIRLYPSLLMIVMPLGLPTDRSFPEKRALSRLGVLAMIVLVIVVGCWLSWVVHRARVQRDAVNAIMRVGGRGTVVSYDWN
jgi:hypothetical protein